MGRREETKITMKMVRMGWGGGGAEQVEKYTKQLKWKSEPPARLFHSKMIQASAVKTDCNESSLYYNVLTYTRDVPGFANRRKWVITMAATENTNTVLMWTIWNSIQKAEINCERVQVETFECGCTVILTHIWPMHEAGYEGRLLSRCLFSLKYWAVLVLISHFISHNPASFLVFILSVSALLSRFHPPDAGLDCLVFLKFSLLWTVNREAFISYFKWHLIMYWIIFL